MARSLKSLQQQRAQTAKWHADFRETHGVSAHTIRRRTARIPHLLTHAKNRARHNGLAFDISIEDLALPIYCPILGLKLDYVNESGARAPNIPSLDRVDNTLGYVKGNVRIISFRANFLKNNISDPTIFRRLADYIEGKI